MSGGGSERRLVLANGRPADSLVRALEAAGFQLVGNLGEVTVWGFGWEIGPLSVNELERRGRK